MTTFSEAYYNRGIINKRLDRVNEARRNFDTAINLFRNAGNEDGVATVERELRDLESL